MATIKLLLDPLVISVGINEEKGPVLQDVRTPLFMSFDKLKGEVLLELAPNQVLSWLFCSAYDAFDVAQVLVAAHYRGTYCAVAGDLPDAAGVAREIRGCFPGLDFHLIAPSTLSRQASVYHDFVRKAGLGAQLTPA